MIKEKNRKTINIFPMIKKSTSEKVTLHDLWYGDEIPFALKSSLAFVYCFHLRTVNVFRRNGNELGHESLCNCMKNNMNAQPSLSIPMIYDVCSAIKAYVRDIPNGLMGKKLLKEWHRIARLSNHESIKKKLKSLIQKLPQANKNLLFHFLVLVSAIIDNQKENSMSSKSLSIVLLPSFFEKVVNFTNIKDLPYFVELLEIMILNSKYLMEPDQFQRIENSYNEIGKKLVIQSHQIHEEKSLLDETKRSIFLSQDSGLNSTSFLDDKGSQSLSGSSQAQANYQRNGNSMEDLLNESDCINMTSMSNDSESNLLRRADSILSLASTKSSHNDDSFSLPINKHSTMCTKQHFDSSYSCIGTKVHSINECRPYTIYGSPSLCHKKWDDSEFNNYCYTPVYDRSFSNFDWNSKNLKPDDVKINEPRPSYFIQRRKPLEKMSCKTVPVEINNNSTLLSGSSTVTITAPNKVSDQTCCNDSLDPSIYSSHSSITSSLSKKNIYVRYTPRRNLKSPRNRYTAPVHPSELKIEVWPPLFHRTPSMNQSNSTVISE